MKRREKSINKSMEKSFEKIRNKSAMNSKEQPPKKPFILKDQLKQFEVQL